MWYQHHTHEYLNLCKPVTQQQHQPSQDTDYLTEHYVRRQAREDYCLTIFMAWDKLTQKSNAIPSSEHMKTLHSHRQMMTLERVSI